MSLIRLSSKTRLNYVALVPSRSEGTLLPASWGDEGMISGRFLRTFWPCVPLAIMFAQSARAEGTFDIPAGAHFNLEKLAKVGEFFNNEVATGKIPGAIVLIRQHGKPVYHKSFGVQDVESKAPITDRTIFRLFSMTKAITSVAAMALVDEGKLRLNDLVSKY